MKIITVIILILNLMLAGLVLAKDEHHIFTEILQEYVKHGLVNYKKLCKDERLEKYIQQLQNTNPDTIADSKRQLAFWLNAYNAYTLKVICDNYPVKSINDLHFGGLVIGTVLKKTIWDKPFVILGHKKYTLNQIEHKIIRPKFKDPRVHFALVCAALSCPPLRYEAYEGDRLDEQLNDQGRKFFSDPQKNEFDLNQKIAHLSKILDWYEKDFGKNKEEVLLYISQFLRDEIASAIQKDPSAWQIKYKPYDWSLNEQKDGTN